MKLNLLLRYHLPHLACSDRIIEERLLYRGETHSVFLTNIFRDITWLSRLKEPSYRYSLAIANNNSINVPEEYVKCLKFTYDKTYNTYTLLPCNSKLIPKHLIEVIKQFVRLYPTQDSLDEKIKSVIIAEFT